MIAKFQACYLPLLAAFAAKSDVRYYLNGFHVEPAPADIGGVYLSATDGHTMILIHDPQGEAERRAVFPIPRLLVSRCKADRNIPATKFVQLDGRMAIVTAGDQFFEHDVGVGCREIAGKFPEVRRVVRELVSRPESDESFLVNAAYFARMNVIAKLEKLRHGPAIRIKSIKDGAVLCTPEVLDHKVFVLIMPMRDRNQTGTPEWVGRFAAEDTEQATNNDKGNNNGQG